MLVDGSASLAKKMKISSLVIGLTVVSFGTSAPELILNILANFNRAADLAIGNVIGSNISNILLIGGLAAIIYPIKIKKDTSWRGIPLSLAAIIILFFLGNDFLGDRPEINFTDGLIFIFFFLVFIYYTFGIAKIKERERIEIKKFSLKSSIALIAVGAIGLAFGGKLVIDNAKIIAETFGISQALIGLTVLAIGTSLPELATSIIAAFKKNTNLAIGNIIGSNIFNIFLTLGISSLLGSLAFNRIFNLDLLICLGASLLFCLVIFKGKKDKQIERWEGVGLVTIYFLYLAFLIWRG